MHKEDQPTLEETGFQIGNAEDFLGLTEEECRLVELRLAVSRAVRRLHEEQWRAGNVSDRRQSFPCMGPTVANAPSSPEAMLGPRALSSVRDEPIHTQSPPVSAVVSPDTPATIR